MRAIARAAPRAEVYELALRAGHFGLVVGSTAAETTWPTVAAWARWRDGEGELPPSVRRVDEDEPEPEAPGVGTRLGVGARARRGRRRRARALARRGRRRAPPAARGCSPRRSPASSPGSPGSAGSSPDTRVSLGLLLDEQAEAAPDADFFLFEDRAHTHDAVKRRIDNVVRGLLSIGVRQGEHVGVLMSTRPSALTVVAALNRLGAVAVLMRPDGPVAREAELGQVHADRRRPRAGQARGRGRRRRGAGARRRRRGARARPRA